MEFTHTIGMQDGGDTGVFARSATGPWRMIGAGEIPTLCPGEMPADVMAALGQVPDPGCDTPPIPTGGRLRLIFGADYYLYPGSWSISGLADTGGGILVGQATDTSSPARIDRRIDTNPNPNWVDGTIPNPGALVADAGCSVATTIRGFFEASYYSPF